MKTEKVEAKDAHHEEWLTASKDKGICSTAPTSVWILELFEDYGIAAFSYISFCKDKFVSVFFFSYAFPIFFFFDGENNKII